MAFYHRNRDGTKVLATRPTSGEETGRGSMDASKNAIATLKRLWAKTGITLRVYALMFKGALAPTIALAAYQSTAWAETYTTIGYLVGVITVLSLATQPRSKFLETMLVQVILSCLGGALAILGCYFAILARSDAGGSSMADTGGSGTSGNAASGAATTTYNSSASAVSGAWLFAQIYFISVLRATLPQYTIPCVMFAIMANISMVYAPQFLAMAQARSFVARLLEAYMTAFGLTTAVSLLVFPLTSRTLLFRDMESFISGLRCAVNTNMTYLNSLEDTDMFAAQRTNTAGQKPAQSPEAEALLAKVRELSGIQGKIATNLTFAKREISLGKLGPDDLQQIIRRLREIMIHVVGLSSMSDIFDRTSEERGWDRSKSLAGTMLEDAINDEEKARIQSLNEWHELLRALKEPFGGISEAIREGLLHVVIVLGLSKTARGQTQDDEMGAGEKPKAGSKAFADYLNRRNEEFQQSKEIMLKEWCHIHGIELQEDFFSNPGIPDVDIPSWMNAQDTTEARSRTRRQLMVMLYVEFLLASMARRTNDLVQYVDRLKENGKLSKTRLIVPGFKRLRKWVYTALREHDMHDDEYEKTFAVNLGSAYKRKKDPEHLPPQHAWERFSGIFQKVGRFFSSPSSLFGLRAAVATLSIGILNYLEDTQVFFTTNRLFWAQIMTSIAMAPSAGQSLRTFLLRIFGTTLSLPLSLIAWYVVDGNIAGIFVFYFIFLQIGQYIAIKYPTRAPVGVILSVTLTLILGYELQVRKVGKQAAESNGQAYYPVYELGAIRLATVVAGLFVAWIFTIFPYPVSEHSQLRRNLGSSLYLLANYYSVLHETVQTRLRGAEGDPKVKGTSGYKLSKHRHQIYVKSSVLLAGLRSQCAYVKFDIRVGGKFPQSRYQRIVSKLHGILHFMSLVSVASTTFSTVANQEDDDARYTWIRNLRKVVSDANITSQSITTLLALLSASVTSGNALPPYLRTPEPYMLSQRLEKLDRDLLSVRHIARPGYASFAVIQIGTQCLIDDLKDLLAEMKELVGELDFSFHIVSTADPTRNNSEETLTYTASHRAEDGRHKQE